jgi:hypothetical protein
MVSGALGRSVDSSDPVRRTGAGVASGRAGDKISQRTEFPARTAGEEH